MREKKYIFFYFTFHYIFLAIKWTLVILVAAKAPSPEAWGKYNLQAYLQFANALHTQYLHSLFKLQETFGRKGLGTIQACAHVCADTSTGEAKVSIQQKTGEEQLKGGEKTNAREAP